MFPHWEESPTDIALVLAKNYFFKIKIKTRKCGNLDKHFWFLP